ncbi:MAG TPA: hypothetical protein VGF55_32550 [Gemmataceae bacterium]|jgi:hypothetical protein
MSRMTLDAAVAERLRQALGSVELCDPAGKVIGRFTPTPDPDEYDLEPQISEEELRRRMESNEPRYTTAEVLKYLESL